MFNKENRWTADVINFLMVYSACHALVDASCAFLLFGAIDVRGDLWLNIVLYNAIAFCLQVPFGFLLDKFGQSKIVSIAGLLCLVAAYAFIRTPLPAVVLAGIGNALFHVGGGQVALSINSRKAVYPGIFVAPGGIGLASGIYLSVSHIVFNLYLFPVSLLIMTAVLFFTKVPAFSLIKAPGKRIHTYVLIIVLLMLSICIRSLIGLAINFPWRSNTNLFVILTLSIAFGKVTGGILADRMGWMKTGLFGLLLAAPLLAFGASYPLAGLVGIFVFNFTMPVTLVAISNVLSGQAGLSFGITTLALFMGAVPTFTNYVGWFTQQWIVFLFILLSAVFLYLGLSQYFRIKNVNSMAKGN
jgi:MFS transporter, FSR family, fosmidomycin resistance protein